MAKFKSSCVLLSQRTNANGAIKIKGHCVSIIHTQHIWYDAFLLILLRWLIDRPSSDYSNTYTNAEFPSRNGLHSRFRFRLFLRKIAVWHFDIATWNARLFLPRQSRQDLRFHSRRREHVLPKSFILWGPSVDMSAGCTNHCDRLSSEKVNSMFFVFGYQLSGEFYTNRWYLSNDSIPTSLKTTSSAANESNYTRERANRKTEPRNVGEGHKVLRPLKRLRGDYSKGDFTRNLKAKLQKETGYVYRYRKTSGIGEEKNLNVFSSGRYSDTLRSSLYRSLLRSKQERKWHMQLFSTQRLVSNDLTKWLNNYDVQNGRVAKHRVYWKEHYQFLFEDTSLSNSRWTLRDLVAVLRDQAFAWERPGHWYANSHQRGKIPKTLFTETR